MSTCRWTRRWFFSRPTFSVRARDINLPGRSYRASNCEISRAERRLRGALYRVARSRRQDEPVRVLAAGWLPANVYASRRCPLAL